MMQPGPWRQPVPTANEGKAVVSLVMGILSLMCFGILTGLPAIVLGFMSRRDIERSGGALGGTGLAIGGIVTGILGSLMSLLTLGMFVFGLFAARSAASTYPTYTPTPTPVPLPTASATGTGTTGPGVKPSFPEESITSRIGRVEVVDVHGVESLKAELVDLRKRAATSGRTLLVQTTATWCGPCKELSAALPDSRMQSALKDTLLARVDVDEFDEDLPTLRMRSDAVPIFYKIDASARPVDAITGDEWDDNVPQNMAPILDAFVRGKLSKRRHPSPVGTNPPSPAGTNL